MEITFKITGDEPNTWYIMKGQDQIGEINTETKNICIDKTTYLTLDELYTIIGFIHLNHETQYNKDENLWAW